MKKSKKIMKIVKWIFSFFLILIMINLLPQVLVDIKICTSYFNKNIDFIFYDNIRADNISTCIMKGLLFLIIIVILICLYKSRLLEGFLKVKKEYIKYCKAYNFNKRKGLAQIKIVQRRDKIISDTDIHNVSEYEKIYKKILKKYEKSNINIERARIKQYFIGDRKKEEDSKTLMAIFTSAILGSFLSSLLSSQFDDISSIGFFLIWLIGATVISIFLNIFIKKSSKETYHKDLYYNLVLEALNEIEKKREANLKNELKKEISNEYNLNNDCYIWDLIRNQIY